MSGKYQKKKIEKIIVKLGVMPITNLKKTLNEDVLFKY